MPPSPPTSAIDDQQDRISNSAASRRCEWSGCDAEAVGVLPANRDAGAWWRRTDTPLCRDHIRPSAWPKDMQAMIERTVMLYAD